MSRPPAPTNDEIRQLNAWLDRALDMDPAARAAWLAGPTVPPGRLREHLLAMLSGHDAPTEALLPAFPLPARDAAGAAPPSAGPYRLLRELGHGGMASVWLARAEGAPDDAFVAVKLPHLHRRRPDFAQRLERERAILATLQHPGITRLLDAGVDQQGQPYLVLELVEGEPIDAWCRRRALGLPARLALWLQAADAVAHAHRQQVLHRDLKPSNLLVTADGRLRLLDFGIAKLLQDGWSVETDLTRQAGRPLTLEYASPEQVRGEPVGVASDVYSIGVVLYELLCSTRPHRLEGRPQAVFETEIVGSAPPLPSQVAADPETRPALAGDLDAVLMKALRKPMHERYRSVDAFADDVRRFLERRPVVAAAELDLPAARSAPQRRLPARDVSLVGRQGDLARVADLLRSERLVTLAGLGGVGKTELAHAVAVTLADEFVDGAIWVDLAVLHAGEQIAAATAAAAGVGLAGDAGTGQVRAALATRHALLVLDNCEHLLAPVAAFAETLLEGAPALRVLATSRERLGLAREQVVRLEPLALPPVTGDLARLRDSAAFQLLEQRVARADLNFRFDSGQALAGAQVCRALDGVPLALEMAAAWVPRLGLEGVLAMLQERPQMLQSTLRGPPLRQRSLDDLLDWSYGLLDAQEQQALRRLSAFGGAFEMAQAEGLLADEAIDRWQARALVASLVEKSLLTAGVDGDSARFRLLETTRGFAARRAEGAGESADIARRHVGTMVQAARQVVAWFDDARSEATLTLGGERWYADLDLAFDRACAAGDADNAALLLQALRNLEALRGVLVAMEARVDAAMRLLPRASPKARAHILAVNASCGWLRDTGLSRTEAARQAVALQRSLSDDPDSMRYPLSLLAVNAALEGHAAEARQALEQAEALRDLARHPERKAMSLVYGAHVERYVGDRQRAVAMLFEALSLVLARGQHRFASYIRFHALEAAAAAGQAALVLEHAPGFIEAMRSQGQREFLVLTCLELARAGMTTGDLDAARIALAEALPIGPEVNRQHDVLGTLAAFALRRGQPQVAARLWGFVGALGAEGEADPSLESCRVALGPAEFDHALALGAAMSAETCHRLALDVLADAAPLDAAARLPLARRGLSPPPPPAARG